MPFDPSRIPDKLREAYRERRCAILVGAGASAGAGLPLWGEFLERMIREGEGHRVVPPAKAAEYRALIAGSDNLLMVAGGLKEDLRIYFDEFIERQFISPKPPPTPLHVGMTKLDRLQFVVTTNYDTLIERAYRAAGFDDLPVLSFKDVGELQRRLSKREFFLLKAHGDAQKPGNSIILTERDYREILYRQPAYQSLVSTIFTMFTVVFIGASLNDPEIKLLLGYITDAFSPGAGPAHFALMSEEDTTGVERERWARDFNVQFIPISKVDGYRETAEFVDALQIAP